MGELEIEDPTPGASAAAAESPYRNLLVPLVVVPALIVMVLVLVFVLFGAIAGDEATPEENVDRLLHGGANERQQAAFNLVGQVLAEWHDPGQADALAVDERLLPKLREAWEGTAVLEDPSDVPIPLALAILMAQIGDSEGFGHLLGMTALDPELDPDGKHRFYACIALGALGERLDERERERAARALVAVLESEDEGLRSAAAIALQTLPSSVTGAALTGLLDEASVEVRLNAALSLARLGDPAGVAVLRESIVDTPYLEQRARDPHKWRRSETIGQGRRKALAALADLGALPPRQELEALATEDPDLLVRELAQELLRGAEGGD